MNVIFIIDGKPDSSRYYTERFGVECCVIEMRSELTNRVHSCLWDPAQAVRGQRLSLQQ